MPNFGYHLARAEANAVRRAYSAALPAIIRRRIEPEREIPFDVFSYSSERDLPEQVASIRSFLKWAGRPLRFTVVSDGTHSPRSIALLEAIDPAINVDQVSNYAPNEERGEATPTCRLERSLSIQGDFSPPDRMTKTGPTPARQYLREHPTGKQLALIMSLPKGKPALYTDSDVLFFPGASELLTFRAAPDISAYYLADCGLVADERIFRDESEKLRPVNTGLLFLFEKLDWSLSLERFADLKSAPIFFTNQTMTHLTMHVAGALPLDPTKYVLQLDDQFVYGDRYSGSAIALRHFVNPVRHKFWNAVLRT